MDTTPNTFPQLCIAYTAVSIILSVYILYLGFRISAIEDRLKGEQSGTSS